MDINYYKSIEPFWGNWRIEKEIGEGAYGKVFLVSREEFGHKYTSAMKVITIPQTEAEWNSALMDGMDEMSVTSMFRGYVEEIVEEIATMSRFKGQSNIVSYEDHAVIEHANGRGWDILIRMELLTPLFTVLPTDRSFDRDQVVKLGMDLCNAISICEKAKVIHRDIKPENIFRSELGDYKLGDFGIARKIDQTIGAYTKKGTYPYMAPEVYTEQPYGASVDTYSLGIVLYRLLNRNRAPFFPPYPEAIRHSDRDSALIRRMKGEQIPLPVDAQDALGAVILKACAYDPAQRYQTAADFSDALWRATSNDPVTNEPAVTARYSGINRQEINQEDVKTEPERMPIPAPPIIEPKDEYHEKTSSFWGNAPIPPRQTTPTAFDALQRNVGNEEQREKISPVSGDKQKQVQNPTGYQTAVVKKNTPDSILGGYYEQIAHSYATDAGKQEKQSQDPRTDHPGAPIAKVAEEVPETKDTVEDKYHSLDESKRFSVQFLLREPTGKAILVLVIIVIAGAIGAILWQGINAKRDKEVVQNLLVLWSAIGDIDDIISAYYGYEASGDTEEFEETRQLLWERLDTHLTENRSFGAFSRKYFDLGSPASTLEASIIPEIDKTHLSYARNGDDCLVTVVISGKTYYGMRLDDTTDTYYLMITSPEYDEGIKKKKYTMVAIIFCVAAILCVIVIRQKKGIAKKR